MAASVREIRNVTNNSTPQRYSFKTGITLKLATAIRYRALTNAAPKIPRTVPKNP